MANRIVRRVRLYRIAKLSHGPRWTLFLALAAALAALMPGQARPEPLALTHVTVLNMTGAAPQRDVTVVIDDGRIADIGEKAKIPAGAKVIDGTGKFLIPGLWDMHAHVFNTTDISLFIANGVTGVRVMAWLPKMAELHAAIESGKMAGPRMSISGRLIDGPSSTLVAAALGQSEAESAKEWTNITTGIERQPRSYIVRNPAEGRAAVVQSKRDGGEAIKIHEWLSRETYLAIADESKKQGLRFVGHVPVPISAAEASNLGQKSIEHSSGLLLACSTDEAALRSATQDLANATQEQRAKKMTEIQRRTVDTFSAAKETALAQTFRKNGTWQCPTLALSLQTTRERSVAAAPRLKYVASVLRTKWQGALGPATNGNNDVAARYNRKLYESVGDLRRQGVDFLTGTDSGAPFVIAGFSLHDELETLVGKAGFTPKEALEAATINAARFLGQEKQLGTIEKGKLADMVLLDANPLDSIGNTRKIRAVIARGQLMDRQAIDRMLAQVEAANAK